MRLAVLWLVLNAAGCFRAPPPSKAVVLLERIDQRLALMQDVARAKWNTKSPVSDPERERVFLRAMADAGRTGGLDPAFTTAFFAAQIDAAKLIQEDAFRTWTAENRGPFPNALDLRRDLRPRIDEVSGELLTALAAYRATRPPTRDELGQLADKSLVGPHITPDVRATAIRPLLESLAP